MNYQFTTRLRQLLESQDLPQPDPVEPPEDTPRKPATGKYAKNKISTSERGRKVQSYTKVNSDSMDFAKQFLQSRGLPVENQNIEKVAAVARGMVYRDELRPEHLKNPNATHWDKSLKGVVDHIMGVPSDPAAVAASDADYARIEDLGKKQRLAQEKAKRESSKKPAVSPAPVEAPTAVPVTAAQHIKSTGRGVLLTKKEISEQFGPKRPTPKPPGPYGPDGDYLLNKSIRFATRYLANIKQNKTSGGNPPSNESGKPADDLQTIRKIAGLARGAVHRGELHQGHLDDPNHRIWPEYIRLPELTEKLDHLLQQTIFNRYLP